jgi:hypothetical protein
MAKADVVTLAQLIAGDVADQLLLEGFYDKALLTLTDTEVTVEATIIAVTSGTATYDWPVDAMRVLSAFFGSRELSLTKLNALEVAGRDWSADTGTPRNYLIDHEQERTVRLYPTPSVTSAAWWPAVGEPFGLDYPTDRLILLTAQNEDAPEWLDFPLAFASLVEEFKRESNHRDLNVAAASARLGKLIRSIGGAP